MVITTDVVKGSCVYHDLFGFGAVILVLENSVIIMFDNRDERLHDANTADYLLKEPREHRANRCRFLLFVKHSNLF